MIFASYDDANMKTIMNNKKAPLLLRVRGFGKTGGTDLQLDVELVGHNALELDYGIGRFCKLPTGDEFRCAVCQGIFVGDYVLLVVHFSSQ